MSSGVSREAIWKTLAGHAPERFRRRPAKSSKIKALNFLGLISPNWAFSEGCTDPPGTKSFLRPFPAPLERPRPAEHMKNYRRF
jgi:hypothetical protein